MTPKTPQLSSVHFISVTLLQLTAAVKQSCVTFNVLIKVNEKGRFCPNAL